MPPARVARPSLLTTGQLLFRRRTGGDGRSCRRDFRLLTLEHGEWRIPNGVKVGTIEETEGEETRGEEKGQDLQEGRGEGDSQ